MLDSYLCLHCVQITHAGAYCSSCGGGLPIATEDLAQLITKRLAFDGFQRTSKVAQDGDDNTCNASNLENQLSQQFQNLLANPPISEGSRTVKLHHFAAIINGEEFTPSEIETLVAETFEIIKKSQKEHSLFAKKVIRFRLYVIYENGCSSEIVRGHKLSLRKKRSLPQAEVRIVTIDCNKKRVLGAQRFSATDTEVKLAVNQIGTNSEVSTAKPNFLSGLAKSVYNRIVQAFVEYMRSHALLTDIPILAHRISTNRYSGKDLVGLFGVSAFLTAIIANIFSIELGGFDSGFSLLDSTLDYIFLLVLYLISAAIYHLPLKLAKGTATFRSTFIGTGYIGAIVQPIIVLFVGIFVVLGVPEQNAWGYAANGTWGLSIPVFSALHQIPLFRTAFVIFVLYFIVAISLVLLLF